MRKVLSFVLVLSLVLGSFSMAFAAPLSDVAGEDCSDAVNVLTELGVVSGYPDGTYKPDNIVTRAEMAVIVVRALGLADYATGVSSFSDMAGHWSNPYVAYATSLGVIAGYPDGTFKPDATVSYDEAATMLVAALGYTPESLQGTWPANYVVKAKSLGILKGIDAGAAGATRGDIATMAYQTLDKAIGSTNNEGEWNAFDSGDNMLGRLGAEHDDDAKVILGTEDSVINLKPFVGAFAERYLNDDGEILAVIAKSEFMTGKLEGTTFTADKVDYNVSSDVATTVPAFTNGADASDEDWKTLADGNTVTIAVDLSGKTIKEVYSVNKWDADRGARFQFEEADADDIAEDSKLRSQKFVLDDNDEIDFNSFELLGADSLDDIEDEAVVYVYSNNDSEITRIEVGTVVEGTVTKVSSEKFTVGGEVYEYAENYASKKIFVPKDEVKLFLDYAGDIYNYEMISGGEADKYAIVLDTFVGSDGLGNKDSQVKLFLTDGSDDVFTIDNDDLTNDDFEGLNITKGAIVKYDVDADGLVNEITVAAITARDEDDITNAGTYAGKYIADDAVIFTATTVNAINVDPFVEAEEDFGVTSLDKVKGSEDVVAAYYYDTDDNRITFMVIEDDATGGGDDLFGVVLEAYKNTSDLGNGVDMLVDGDEVSYDSKNLETADNNLYKLVFDTEGNIKDLEVVVTEGDFVVGNITSDSGVTIRVSNNVLTVVDGTTSGGFFYGNQVSLAADVVIYTENSDGDFEVGSISDLRMTDEDLKVVLFDVYGKKDGIVDIVLIYTEE